MPKRKGNYPFTCLVCGKVTYRWKYQNIKFCTRQCMGAFYSKHPNIGTFLYRNMKGENHYKWKGDKVGYDGLHDWVKKLKGKAYKCEDCGTTEAAGYDWANISGQYKRDLNDFKSLCKKCHARFDRRGEKIKEKYGDDFFRLAGLKGLRSRYGGDYK